MEYVLGWIGNFMASQPFQSIITSIMNGWRSWDWVVGSETVTTTCFGWRLGVKLASVLYSTFTQRLRDFGWFRHFTASQLFQCIIVSMMNACARLRLESFTHVHHHTPAYELRVGTILVEGPTYISYKDGICFGLNWELNGISTLPIYHY